MTVERRAIFLLDEGLGASLSEGRHNFLCKVREVLEGTGFITEVRRDSIVEQMSARSIGAWTLMHMAPVLDDRSVTIRRVYHYPFWSIEQTHERWNWRVAKTPFDPSAVARKEADRFFGFWANRLFGDAVTRATRGGFVYVPLQGRLRVIRSFQSSSPLRMLRAVCESTDKPVKASLHPREIYDTGDREQIGRLLNEFPKLEITEAPMEQLLTRCDAIVTENSSVAFNGFFFGKPAILFAQSDFHHIALRGEIETLSDTLGEIHGHEPDYAGYIHWFWQLMSINAGRETATDKIIDALLRAGWPLDEE